MIMHRPVDHDYYDERDWEDLCLEVDNSLVDALTSWDRSWEDPDHNPMYGISAIIGTDPDFPMTSRNEYLGIDRSTMPSTTEAMRAGLHQSIGTVNEQAQAQGGWFLPNTDENQILFPHGLSQPSAPTERQPDPYVDLPIGLHPFENLSGTAGTGKTWMAKRLATQAKKGSIIVAATTGIAAVNLADEDIETTTINAALKYFDTKDLQERYTNGILQAVLRKHRRCGVRRIIIDEKSMMSGQQLTLISRAVDEVNQPRDRQMEAIGMDEDLEGMDLQEEQPQIGITLVGDFGQLPPVPDDDPKTGKKLPVQFCFDSPEWPRFADHTTTLTKIWRQDNQDFIRGLHAVRRGDVTTALTFFTPDRFSTETDDAFEGTTIFAKNDAVDRYNGLRLDRLQTPPMSFVSTRKGKQRPDWKNIPSVLAVKEGALVMILSNHRVYEDEDDSTGHIVYANGDLGTVIGAQENRGGWSVRLHRNQQVVTVIPIIRENTIPLEPGRWKELVELHGAEGARAFRSENGKGRSEVIGTIMYMPLRLGWASTVHKSQGLSLDLVQVNLRDPFFKQPGMMFVAFSRARTIEGLRIVGNQTGFVERCRMEARVLKWL